MEREDLTPKFRLAGVSHVLVTGAAGKLGRATVAVLGAHGISVTAFSRDYAEPIEADRVFVGDARREADVASALERADAVVHLAAIPHPSLGTPYEVYSMNVLSTFNVLAQAGQHGVTRVLIASSINAMGTPMNHHDVMPPYFPLDERQPPLPDDAYSLSKLSDEWTARMAASRWGMSVIAYRFPFIGTTAELDSYSASVIGQLRSKAREGWSYLHLDDAAHALMYGLTASTTGAEVVAIAADDTCVPYATQDLLDRYAPGVRRLRVFEGRSVPVDTSRVRELTGFVPRFALGFEPISLPYESTEPTVA